MSSQFLTTFDECGDLAVCGGWVQGRNGVRIRVGPELFKAGPRDQVGEIEAQDTPARIYLGGSGRNLVVTGWTGTDAPNGVWQHGRPNQWKFGEILRLIWNPAGGAAISDGTDDVATLASGGPAGSYASTAYGESLYGGPFTATVALETGWPGTLPDAELESAAALVPRGIYTASDAATFQHPTMTDWTIVVAADGSAQIIFDGTPVATREAGPGDNPAGGYLSEPAGLEWNPVPFPDADDALPAANPFGILTITYSWSGSPDLDTTTKFLAGIVGFGSGSSADYMTFTGDNTTAGSETVAIDLAQAWEDGHLGSSAEIECCADWYPPAGGSGPAMLEVTYSLAGSPLLSRTIHPPSNGTPASTVVAGLRIDAAGALTENFAPWEASVIRLRVPPPAGVVYLTIIEAAGVLDSVAGPFFAAAAPANTSTDKQIVLAISDGLGGVEAVHRGPIIWPT